VWEADHVQAPLYVEADGELVRPYVTWFIDCATKAVTGVAVTPGCPTRASILAALRSAVLRTKPYGPLGGRPEQVRFDRGKDFLSRTVVTALTALDTNLTVLPPYSPHLKGSIENLNRCAERMLFAALPGYTAKKPSRRPDRRPPTPVLSFHDFTEQLLARVTGGTPSITRPRSTGVPRWRPGRPTRPRSTTSRPRMCGPAPSRATAAPAPSPAMGCVSVTGTTSPTG
jgi:transposase InsO family protein